MASNINTTPEILGRTIFDELRSGLAYVAERSEHVKINEELIEEYVLSLDRNALTEVLDTDHHFIGSEEATASYIVALDSINFGSGYKPHLLSEGFSLVDNSFYFATSTRLKNYYIDKDMVEAGELLEIQTADIADILALDISKQYSAEFAGMCASALNELGENIAGNYDGSFMRFVESAEGSAEKMVRKMLEMENFRDIHKYHGTDIVFYKRAQITVIDLQLAFKNLGHELFSGTDQVTMFADNGIPHVLKVDGILEYSDILSSRIDNGEEIPSGSEEEIEIRGCAAHAVELMSKISDLTSVNIDHILWHRGISSDVYRKVPTHRTLTHFY
jgi:hypothetical protein